MKTTQKIVTNSFVPIAVIRIITSLSGQNNIGICKLSHFTSEFVNKTCKYYTQCILHNVSSDRNEKKTILIIFCNREYDRNTLIIRLK